MRTRSNQPCRLHNLGALTHCKRKVKKIDSGCTMPETINLSASNHSTNENFYFLFNCRKEINLTAIEGQDRLVGFINIKRKNMMNYKIRLLENDFSRLQINNMKFESESDLVFDLPQILVSKIHSDNFPVGVAIRPFQNEVSKVHYFKPMPIIIENIGNGLVRVDIEACKVKENWNFPIDIECFQLLKAEAILTRKEVNPKIDIFNTDDAAVHLHYIIDLPSDTIKRILEASIKFDKDVTVKAFESASECEYKNCVDE